MSHTIRCLVLVALASTAFGQDISGMMAGRPLDDVWPSSNTAVVFGFWGAKAQTATLVPRNPDGTVHSNWTTTRTQYFQDGTTTILYRHPLAQTLTISNRTTYTIHVMVNSRNGNGQLNETTPTLNTSNSIWVLETPTSGYPYMLELDRNNMADQPFFPIYNVVIYPYVADITVYDDRITSSLVSGLRMQGR